MAKPLPAKYTDWRRGVLAMIGAPVTPGNLRLLSTWQRWEGGHTNNSAKYNWLNTTMNAPGAVGTMNDVGVRIFRDMDSGINATAATLLNGRYDDIVKALRSGKPYQHDLTAGLSTWVSGSPTGNLEYARKVMGGSATPKAAPPRGGRGSKGNPGPVAAPPATTMDEDVWDFIFRDDPEFLSILNQFGAPTPVSNPEQRSGPPQKPQGTQLKPGGGWGGSEAMARSLADLGRKHGLSIVSEKRDRQHNASGGVSDHWTGSKNAYAFDLSNGSRPTKEMDQAAIAIMRALGVDYDGKSELVRNVNIGGYRVQVIYRSNVGGNHHNHIHIGVRKL